MTEPRFVRPSMIPDVVAVEEDNTNNSRRTAALAEMVAEQESATAPPAQKAARGKTPKADTGIFAGTMQSYPFPQLSGYGATTAFIGVMATSQRPGL